MGARTELIRSFRILSQFLCTVFRKHIMTMSLKLFMFVSRLVELYLKEQKMCSIFGDFSFSVMNDISDNNYRIAYLWWYMDREHSQQYLEPLQVIITLELCKV